MNIRCASAGLVLLLAIGGLVLPIDVNAQQKLTATIYPNMHVLPHAPLQIPTQSWTGQYYGPANPLYPALPSNLPPTAYSPYSATVVPVAGTYYSGYTPVYCCYPSIYSSYIGLPVLEYGSDYGVNVYNTPPTLFENGTFYSLSNDPYAGGISYTPFASSDVNSGANLQSAVALPTALQQSLGDISTSWTSNDDSGIDSHISSGSLIDVVDGNSSYAVNPSTYQIMTRDAVANLRTTAFRFTGVRLQSSGDAVAYGTQVYQGRTGAQSKMYVAYLLHKDTTGSSYVIRGMKTSSQPLTPYVGGSSAAGRG